VQAEEVGIVACLSAVDLLVDMFHADAVHNAYHYILIFFLYINLLLLFGTCMPACSSGLLAAFSLQQASKQ
jgi:hypothetical protein